MKGKKTSNTPGDGPSEPTLTRHVRPEESPISPKPGPRETSAPKTEKRSQIITKKLSFSIIRQPTPLQKEIPKVTSPILQIKAKDYNFVFDGNEVEKSTKRVETAAEIKEPSGDDIARHIIFMSASEEVKETIEAKKRL
ncbi:hypothetical protein O181_029302 [Austropuccinia psidii MF-1]|uniref:Uncharacterized protein n=1 Tax=Austropuccinia psidii MF-1 TaxID=1389203 RepID=A0A9Q3CWB0_9BASI|nr:hypothetical protein [Austropuccinia psidii MF-1]